MSWWGGERPAKRRPANGIKAQTQRGKFGQSWWGGRWIAALERLVDAGRLSRGRSYARSGQVLSLDHDADGVKARVQGSPPRPYQVLIAFRHLTDAEWERIFDAMAAQALYAARLLSGEMPEQIEEVFAAVGLSLFPASERDLVTSCSCPDWSNPCKHVAAVYYLLGERFDADPFLIFELRGRDEEAIITALRARRGAAEPRKERDESAPTPVAEEPPALDHFWGEQERAPDPVLSFDAPPVDALAIKRLGPAPFWRGPLDLVPELEQRYRDIAEAARRLALGGPPGDTDEQGPGARGASQPARRPAPRAKRR